MVVGGQDAEGQKGEAVGLFDPTQEVEETSDLDGLLEDRLAAGESVVDVIDPTFLELPRHTRHDLLLSILTTQQSQKG